MFLHMNNVIGWFGDCRDDGDFHKDLATILQLWRCSAIWIMSMQIQVPARLQQCRPSGTSPRRALCQLRSRGGQLHHQLLTEATTPSATMQLHHQLLKKLPATCHQLIAATPSAIASHTITANCATMLARRSDESQTYASQSVLEAETDTIHIALIESNKVFIQPACALYFQQANWSLSFIGKFFHLSWVGSLWFYVLQLQSSLTGDRVEKDLIRITMWRQLNACWQLQLHGWSDMPMLPIARACTQAQTLNTFHFGENP